MKKLRFQQLQRFVIIMEADEPGGYHAFCPTLPGCHSQGETLEEAKKNIQEAIQCHLESLIKDGEPLPIEREEFVGTIQVSVPSKHGR